MLKKAFFSFMSIFLMWQSYNFLTKLHQLDIDSFVLTLFLAWLLSLFVTGIFAFAVFAWPVEKLLPDSYYHIKTKNNIKKIYKLLKVEWFRKALLATLWRSKKQQKQFFDGTINGLRTFLGETTKAEFGHLLPFIILVGVSIYCFILGKWLFGVLLGFINIIGNFYPILLQRYHRTRANPLLERIRKRKE